MTQNCLWHMVMETYNSIRRSTCVAGHLSVDGELVTLEGHGHGAWNAVVDGKGLFELSYDFLMERQNLEL